MPVISLEAHRNVSCIPRTVNPLPSEAVKYMLNATLLGDLS